jgi:hypothetical protein
MRRERKLFAHVVMIVTVVLSLHALESLAQTQPVAKTSVAKPETIQPDWGEEKQGVRVALNLDKLTFDLGEDVAAHISAQVVSASQPVYGEPFRARPAFGNDMRGSFRIFVMDDDGPLVRDPSEDFYNRWMVSGPSLPPPALPVGNAIPWEMSLKKLGLLPGLPGRYQLKVTWSVYRANNPSPSEDGNRVERPFVTVVSRPVVIQIVGTPKTDIADVPEYTAWKSKFSLADTQFGEKTALYDQETGLEWLRTPLTQNPSLYLSPLKDVSKRMEKEGDLEGWRFATLTELKTFLSNFTGTPDGRTTDPAIVRKLIRLLGGDSVRGIRNDETGWSRIALYARIAKLRPATFEETPRGGPYNPPVVLPCSTCPVGFMQYCFYAGEDRQHGRVTATVMLNEGWTDGTGSGVGGFFLVRKR